MVFWLRWVGFVGRGVWCLEEVIWLWLVGCEFVILEGLGGWCECVGLVFWWWYYVVVVGELFG